jgi:protein-disulfide isomerase
METQEHSENNEHQEEQHHMSKAERRQMKKERGQEKRHHENKQKKSKAHLGWGALIVAVILGLYGIYSIGNSSTPTIPIDDPFEVLETDHTKGNPNADVILFEFSDLQCPACKSYFPVVQQMNEEFEDDVLIVYRHYPLTSIHPNAQEAAMAAEAAGKQGKFWEMHDELFSTQSQWNSLGRPNSFFTDLAEDLQLDLDQFKADLKNKDLKAKVKRDQQTGDIAGVTGTPSFFLNGKKLQNPRGPEAFREVLQEAIK